MSKRHFIQTESILQSLKEYAKNFKTPSKNIDFSITRVITKYKNSEDADWIEVEDEDQIQKLQDPEFLHDESLSIKQSYEIEIYKIQPRKRLNIHVGANKDRTKVVFVLPERLKLKYSTKLEEYIRTNIEKQMALHGYLIGLWDEKEQLNEFFDVLQEANKVRYGQRQYILVAKSPLPKVAPVHDALVYSYKASQIPQSEYDRVDYSKRGFAFGVKEGDTILQYIKPKEGRCGRDCKGKFLPVSEPKQNNVPDFSISENIEIKEDEDKTDYIAKRSGYVVFSENRYDIEQYLEVDRVDFKTTGDIDLGVESDVRLIVNGSSDMADSIGQGMEVNAKEINVLNGTVGSGVIIHASKVGISSITHQNSKIYGDDITINVHNGFAKGKSVYVKRLEGGVIEGDKVTIEQAVGGEVRANEVYIDTMTSNSIIYASNTIEVSNLKGEDNEFMIDPTLVDGLKEEIEYIEKQIDKFETARKNIYKELKQKRVGLRQNENLLKKVKETIIENKQKGVKTPATYLQKLKKLQTLIKNVRILDEEIILINEELNNLRSQISVKQSIVLNAKVVNKNRWSGYNKVSFALISPEIVKETTTQGKKNVIRLKEGVSGEFEIESHDIDQDQ